MPLANYTTSVSADRSIDEITKDLRGRTRSYRHGRKAL